MMNMFSRLQDDPTLNRYQRRASLARRLSVLFLCGLVFTFTAGTVVLGLFLPGLLWLVTVAICVLLVGVVVSLIFIGYCSYKDFGSASGLPSLFAQSHVEGKGDPVAQEEVIEGEFRIIQETDARNN
jgi:purine-cytosine permease-like protein